MAAFTAPCASTTTTTVTTAAAARQRQGGKRENGDVGQNTIVEKTHQFFQMCDIESKGFITQSDMQVSSLTRRRCDSKTPSPHESNQNFNDVSRITLGVLLTSQKTLLQC